MSRPTPEPGGAHSERKAGDPPELDLPSRGPDDSLLVELRDLEERVRDQAHELIRLLRGGAPGPYGRPRPSSRARRPLVIPARPGRSGRQPRVDRQYVTDATAELVRELGEPSVVRSHGAVVNVWQLDPDGDGILAGRLSADDVKGGETAFSQLHALRELATELDLKPAYAVISLRLSGRRDFEQRDDLAIILQRLRAGDAKLGRMAQPRPDRAQGAAGGALLPPHAPREGSPVHQRAAP